MFVPPTLCDEFRSKAGDKYIAIKVNITDLYAWSADNVKYPHKIAFRKGEVLCECDKFGKKMKTMIIFRRRVKWTMGKSEECSL